MSARSLIPFVLLIAVSGCASRKALVDLPEADRRSIAFTSSTNRPAIRFASEGSREAMRFGGVVGFAVGHSIASSTNAYGASAGLIGTFEQALLSQLFTQRLQSVGVAIVAGPASRSHSTLTVSVVSVGLRELERYRFTPFVHASARLTDASGKELWAATAKGTGTEVRPLQAFRDNPEQYREDFRDAAEDVVRQLVEGPVRQISF